jgi:hypothetical protein
MDDVMGPSMLLHFCLILNIRNNDELCCRCFLGSFNREEKSLSKIKGYNDRAKT